MNPTSEAERSEQRDDARRANLRRDAGSLLESWKRILRAHQTGLLGDFLTTQTSPGIKAGWRYSRGELELDQWLKTRLSRPSDELHEAYVEFRRNQASRIAPTLDDALAGRKMFWASGDHATFLRLFRAQAGVAAAPRDLEERIEALIQAVVTPSPPPRPPRPLRRPAPLLPTDAPAPQPPRRPAPLPPTDAPAPQPPRRPAPQPPTNAPARVIPAHRPAPPAPRQAPQRDKGKGKEGAPTQQPRQAPPVPPKIRTKGNARVSPLRGQPDLARWKDPAAKQQKAVLKEVVLDPSPVFTNRGGGGPVGFDVDGVRVSSAARLDSPDVMWVNLVTGEKVRAVRRDVDGAQINYSLRYLRHGRVRSSHFDLAALSRYRLIDLTCTVAFKRCRYWIPTIERWLYATNAEQYFGLANLQVAFAETTVAKQSAFLKSLALDFETKMNQSAGLQTVQVVWEATKVLADDSGDVVDGYLELNTQTTALTPTDGRSKAYFTVTRS